MPDVIILFKKHTKVEASLRKVAKKIDLKLIDYSCVSESCGVYNTSEIVM